MDKILITGATGHLGKDVINMLLNKIGKDQISALVRNPLKAEDLKNKGVEIRVGDYDNYDSLVNAFGGIDKLYFVSGSDVMIRLKQHENIINAAKESKVKHVLYTSFVRKNETETSPIAMVSQSHLKTEEWLKQSGLIYTILKHNLYMDFLPMFMGKKVVEKGLIYLPAGNGKAAFTLRNDMAKVGAAILTSEGHENKEYEISADKNFSYHDVAKELSEISGKTINYVSPSIEEYSKTLSQSGVPNEYIGMLAGFSDAIKQGEFESTSNIIEQLTGNKSVSLSNFLRSVYSK